MMLATQLLASNGQIENNKVATATIMEHQGKMVGFPRRLLAT